MSDKDDDLEGWDRTSYLLRFFPVVGGYAVNRWKGRCVLSIDEIVDLARANLYEAIDIYPGWCEGRDFTPNGRAFWGFLKNRIDWGFLYHIRNTPYPNSLEGLTTFEDDNDVYMGRVLLAAADLARVREHSLLHFELVRRVQRFAPRWQMLLALRYYEELPGIEVARIAGEPFSTSNHILDRARIELLNTAHRLVLDDPPEAIESNPRITAVTPAFEEWVTSTGRAPDAAAYLNDVLVAHALDVTCLIDVLNASNGRGPNPGRRGSRVLSPDDEMLVDELLRDGTTKQEIARRLEVSDTVVRKYSRRRAA